MDEFVKKVKEAIKRFNEKYGAESELLKIDGDEIIVHVKGHICFTCGAYDYFEDLAFELSDVLGKEYAVAKEEQLEDGTYVVHYLPVEKVEKVIREVTVMIYDNVEKVRLELPKRG